VSAQIVGGDFAAGMVDKKKMQVY